MVSEELEAEIQILKKQKEFYQNRLRKLGKPQSDIAYILLTVGAILLTLSILHNHVVAAFIGIALIFWGSLFLYIKPSRFIQKEIFDSTITGILATISTFVGTSTFEGIPMYYSIKTLSGIRNPILIIPPNSDFSLPPSNELSKDKYWETNPQIKKMKPIGIELFHLIEKELGVDITLTNLTFIEKNIEKVIIDNLELVKTFNIVIQNPNITVIFTESIFDEIFNNLEIINKYNHIFNPLISALSCIITISSKQPIMIENVIHEQEKRRFTITYQKLS